MRLPAGMWLERDGKRRRYGFREVISRKQRRLGTKQAALEAFRLDRKLSKGLKMLLENTWVLIFREWAWLRGAIRCSVEQLLVFTQWFVLQLIAIGDLDRAKALIEQALASAHVSKEPELSVAAAIEQFLASKALRGVRARTDSDLRSRLKRFQEDFPGAIGAVSAAGVQRWFLGLVNRKSKRLLAARTRNNFLAAVQNLFHSAELKGLGESRAIGELQEIPLSPPAKAIWAPWGLLSLLVEAQFTDRALIPVIALGAFAGLRTAEALRLDASDVLLEDAENPFVIVQAAKTKVAEERTVALRPNAAQWLRVFAPAAGPMWVGHENTFHRRVRLLCKRAGLSWKDNGLRKSFCTYENLLTHDLAKQSRQAGNSPAMQKRYYLAPRKASSRDAKAWFDIRPGDAIQGVLAFPVAPSVPPEEAPAAVLL